MVPPGYLEKYGFLRKTLREKVVGFKAFYFDV